MGSSDDGGGDPSAQYQNNAPMPDLPVSGTGGSIDPYNYGSFQSFLPDIPPAGRGPAPSATGLTSEMFQYRSPSGTLTPVGGGDDANRGALAQIMGKGNFGGIGVGPGGAGGYVGARGPNPAAGAGPPAGVATVGQGTLNPFIGQTMGANGTPNGPVPTAGYGGLINSMNLNPNPFAPPGGGGEYAPSSTSMFAAPTGGGGGFWPQPVPYEDNRDYSSSTMTRVG